MPAHELKKHYQVCIIGGGIQGAGCAQAMAARGYSTLLLEKTTHGAETSSHSSKLIHGGLRYLESGQLSLVHKSLQERSLLLRLAPELVQLKEFYLPIYKKQRLGKWKLRAGLSMYAALGGLQPEARFTRLHQRDWLRLPGLNREGLECVFQYSDAQTDDLLLTRSVMQSAVSLGCHSIEHATFKSANPADATARNGSYHIEFEHQGKCYETSCDLLVNASGPWIDQVQANITDAPPCPAIELVRGSHLEFDSPICDGIFYIESPIDQRPVFIMPWQGRTLVGTTEQAHCEAPEASHAQEQEISYLENTLRHYFPNYAGKPVDCWSGLRVLPRPEGAKASLTRPFANRARDTIVLCDNEKKPRVISLCGGKLTSYRVTADSIGKLAENTLGTPLNPISTASITLTLPE